MYEYHTVDSAGEYCNITFFIIYTIYTLYTCCYINETKINK